MAQKVVACYKWVLDEADVSFDQDLKPQMSRASSKISTYDRNAIEAAVQACQGEDDLMPVGLTCGSEAAEASLKEALARGLDEAYRVNMGAEPVADYVVAAEALAKAVAKMGDVALVICADGSSDLFGRQMGPRLGAVLDWPVASSVVSFAVKDGVLTAERKLEDVVETVEMALPAVISVLPEINKPEMPGMRAILAARKKPSFEYASADLELAAQPASKVVEVKGYKMERKNIVFDGDSVDDSVAEFVAALRKEGVVS